MNIGDEVVFYWKDGHSTPHVDGLDDSGKNYMVMSVIAVTDRGGVVLRRDPETNWPVTLDEIKEMNGDAIKEIEVRGRSDGKTEAGTICEPRTCARSDGRNRKCSVCGATLGEDRKGKRKMDGAKGRQADR